MSEYLNILFHLNKILNYNSEKLVVNFIISENEQEVVKKFITFNRDNNTLIDNYYLNDFKVVISNCLASSKHESDF